MEQSYTFLDVATATFVYRIFRLTQIRRRLFGTHPKDRVPRTRGNGLGCGISCAVDCQLHGLTAFADFSFEKGETPIEFHLRQFYTRSRLRESTIALPMLVLTMLAAVLTMVSSAGFSAGLAPSVVSFSPQGTVK